MKDNWVFVKLPDLIGKNGIFCDGDWVESKDQDVNGDVRLIQLADIGDVIFKNKSDRYLTYNKALDLNCTFLSEGDILIARLPDPLGRSCIFPLSSNKKYVTVVDVCILRVDETIVLKKFINFIINSPTIRFIIKGLESGTTRKRISKSNLGTIPLPLPPLPEQRAIVAKIEQLFSELDSGVENLKKAQAQLKVYRQAVLKWAFEGKLTEEWRKQQKDLPTAETLFAQIKTQREKQAEKSNKKLKPIAPISKEELAELPKLPEGWVWTKIGHFTLGVEYGTSAKSKKNGKVPVLRMGNIQSGKFNWDDLVFTDDQEEINKYLLKKNDVLFNRTNSPELVGKTAIYKGERQAIFAGYIIRVNQIPTIVNSDYLNYFLNCHYAKKHGFSVKTDGVNQSNINGEKLVNYPISICTFTEQHQIVLEIEERLSVCDKLEETIAHSLQKAESLRQSILKKAFAGKLLTKTELEEVRKAPDWEPAENLLQRIKNENEKG